MASKQRKHIRRKVVIAAGVAFLVVVAAAMLGSPFVRGIAVGTVGSMVGLVVLAKLLQRRIAKRVPAQLEPPPLPTAAWDYSMQASDLSGAPVTFDVLRGNVAVLNFWATWCVPCTAEMPSLFHLRELTSEIGVQFAFLSNEPREVLAKFNERKGWMGPFYQFSGDAPECFRTRGIPATFVLDRAGRIALRHFGAARWDHERIVTFLRSLAATPQA
jgi:thiol-disulfide isomerase/thioredoxin